MSTFNSRRRDRAGAAIVLLLVAVALGNALMAVQAAVADARIISVNDGGSADRHMLYAIGGGSFAVLVTDGGVTQGAITYAGNATGITRLASSLQANRLDLAVNGGAGTPDTSATMPTVNAIHIGHYGGALQLGGWVRRIGIAPITRTTAELQALTA